MPRSRANKKMSKLRKKELPPPFERKLADWKGREKSEHLKVMTTFRVNGHCCPRGSTSHPHRRPLKLVYGTCFQYTSYMCDDPVNCPDGDNCFYAHNNFEMVYHPRLYKTQPCQTFERGEECMYGPKCTKAHGASDLRDRDRIFGVNWESLFQDPEPLKQPYLERNPPQTRVRIQNTPRPTPNSQPRPTPRPMPTPTPTRDTPKVVEVRTATPTPPSVDDSDWDAESEVATPVVAAEAKIAEGEKEGEGGEDSGMNFDLWVDSNFRRLNQRQDIKNNLKLYGLDDLTYLLDLCRENAECLQKQLVDVCNLDLSLAQLFVRKMKDFIRPKDIAVWLERVVRLPQYVELFEDMNYEKFDDIRNTESFLNEIRDEIVSLSGEGQGHWHRIAFYLRQHDAGERRPGEKEE